MSKYIYIFEMSEGLTNSYHSGGGLVVIAENIETAHNLIKNHKTEDCYRPTINLNNPISDPIFTIELKEDIQNKVFLFPDAGCC